MRLQILTVMGCSGCGFSDGAGLLATGSSVGAAGVDVDGAVATSDGPAALGDGAFMMESSGRLVLESVSESMMTSR